jgi:penicillin-binding protein 2
LRWHYPWRDRRWKGRSAGLQLSELTGKTTQSIYEAYEDAGPTWFVPIGEASADEINQRWNAISNLGGWSCKYDSRYYYNGGIAPQAIGYVLGMSEEQQTEYIQKGYVGDEASDRLDWKICRGISGWETIRSHM